MIFIKKIKYEWMYFMIIFINFFLGCNQIEIDENSSIYKNQKNFARFELPQQNYECSNDNGCFIGGCNGETCTAQQGIITTCDVSEGMKQGISCKCINATCIWKKNEK